MSTFYGYTNIIRSFVTGCFLLLTGVINGQNLVPDNIERDALLALYTDTNGENWAEFKRWTLSRINSFPDSILYGVTIENGDISSINLSSAGLVGTLPTEIDDLTELVSFSV